MRVSVTHHLDDLQRDCEKIPVIFMREGAKVVAKKVREGNKAAQWLARSKSGPHGTAYYKRITSEMTGPLAGEWGPTGAVAGNAVGAGWRHGPPNNDMPQSADLIAPEFAYEVEGLIGKLFWPGA
jgi:hypothetical protein